jgi:hypothetical protein
VKPSRAWFLAAPAVAMSSLAIAGVLALSQTGSLVESASAAGRTEVPGTVEMALEPGAWTVYQEFPGASAEGAVTPPAVEVAVQSPDGSAVALRPYPGVTSYGQEGREGRAVRSFDVDQAGAYVLTATGEPSAGALTVGPSVLPRLQLALAVLVIGSALALLLVVVGVVLRYRARTSTRPSVTRVS